MPRVTRWSRWALLAYTLVLGIVLLQPEPRIAASVVIHAEEWLAQFGSSGEDPAPGRVEAVLNAAMFVPLAALALLSFPRLRWPTVALLGFAASLSVEVVQAVLLNARSAQLVDVVANTVGTLIGAALGVAIRHSVSVATGPDRDSTLPD